MSRSGFLFLNKLLISIGDLGGAIVKQGCNGSACPSMAVGAVALVAACFVATGASAQVVQGGIVGPGTGISDVAGMGDDSLSLGDARSRLLIYAQGPSPVAGSAGLAAGPGSLAFDDPLGQASPSATFDVSASHDRALALGGLPGGQSASDDPRGGGGVSPVPEPDTWVTMIVGFGLAAFGLRRRSARPLPA